MVEKKLAVTSSWEDAKGLADKVLMLWDKSGRDINKFPEISQRVLCEDSVANNIDIDELLFDLMTASDEIADYQRSSQFSDLPLNLYADEDIIVQALYWKTATTSIHNHTFCGAFKVLRGSSIHCEYLVSDIQRFDESVAYCQMEIGQANFLREGDTCAIKPGMEMVHSVYHLESPSVTLLIALNARHLKLKQMEFVGFNFAVSHQQMSSFLVRKLQALELIRSRSISDYEKQLIA